MRQIFTLLSFFLLTAAASAQFTFQPENMGPFVGDQWAAYDFILPLADNPIPADDGTVSYDYAYLGDIVDVDAFDTPLFDSMAIKEVSLDSFLNTRVLPAPTEDDVSENETFGFPDYGDDVLQFEVYFPAFFNEDDDEGSVRSFVRKEDDGLFQFGFAIFSFEENGIFFIDTTVSPELLLPYDFAPGDSVENTSIEVEPNLDFGTEDSTVTIVSFVYLNSVSLTTHFGQYDNVARVRSIFQNDYYTRPIDSDEPFTLASRQRDVDYLFYQEGNAAPLITYSYSIADLSTLEPVTDDINIGFNQPVTLVDVAEEEAARLRLTTFPNPAAERVTVAFEQPSAQPVQVVLLDINGRQLARRSYGNLPAGSRQLSFDLPRGLPVGTYLLQVVSGRQTTARTLVVR
ncbi:MAG: T9SS type A sorting domain-containing protein [Saprospiraceae bacterium]